MILDDPYTELSYREKKELAEQLVEWYREVLSDATISERELREEEREVRSGQ